MFRSLSSSLLVPVVAAIVFAGCQKADTLHTSSIDHGSDLSRRAEQPAAGLVQATETVLLTVYGMSCPLCASNVDKQLLRIDGVKAVDVDLSSGLVTLLVSKSNPPSAASLAKAVSESGFTLVGEPQMP